MDFETTLANLRSKLEKSNFEEFSYKIPGELIHIVPCSDKAIIFEESDIDYYLMYSDTIYGGESLAVIAEQIVNCETIKQNISKEEKKIRTFFDKHIDTDTPDYEAWDFYCDWHKDVFGFRPRGIVCGNYVSERNKKEQEITKKCIVDMQ